MSSAEIKALRKDGKLVEALQLALSELEQQPDNLWNKRNLSWVHYEYLKKASAEVNFEDFIHWLNEVKKLELPEDEKILYEQIAWQIGSMVFKIASNSDFDVVQINRLIEYTKGMPLYKPSEAYTFIFKGYHKALKETAEYIEFADWWGFENFRPEDFLPEKIKDGREIMAIAEQAFIAYAKHILNQKDQEGHTVFDKNKALEFSDKLSEIIEQHPKLVYLPYYKAKLLLALGDQGNVLSALLPFARKKQNDFWVWDILSEAFHNEPDKAFACLCKALSCKSPAEMLVTVRQKMAGALISKHFFNEAKTEIVLLLKAREKAGYKTPPIVNNWISQAWYSSASAKDSNISYYNEFLPLAESLLFGDISEISVVVEFINTDKKILNYITTDLQKGFFKYDRFLNKVAIGDILAVRFQTINSDGPSKVLSVSIRPDEFLKNKLIKVSEGIVRIREGSSFGFIEDAFINPALIKKYKLTNGMLVKAEIIRSYNEDKKSWGWKVFEIIETIG